jgi:hypothetical protein
MPSRAEPTAPRAPPESTAALRDFPVIGGAPDSSHVVAQEWGRQVIIARHHRRSPPPQGRQTEFPTSPRSHRKKPHRKWSYVAAGPPISSERPWLPTISLLAPPLERRLRHRSKPEPTIHDPTRTFRTGAYPFIDLIWVLDPEIDSHRLLNSIDPCAGSCELSPPDRRLISLIFL